MKFLNPMLLTDTVTINPNLDLDSLAGGIISIVIRMALYVGIIVAVGGVFSFVIAYKEDFFYGEYHCFDTRLCAPVPLPSPVL